MARASISIVIPSIGRDTLGDALKSCADADEVILVFDDAVGRDNSLYRPHPNIRVTGVVGGDMGYTARNLGMALASSSHIGFLDDDDVFLPDAFTIMREHAVADRPTVFRMDHPASIFWRDPHLQYGNVGTPMILVPNTPSQLGVWEEHAEGIGGDYRFLKGCCVKMGHNPKWVSEVTSVVRPHERAGVLESYLAEPNAILA